MKLNTADYNIQHWKNKYGLPCWFNQIKNRNILLLNTTTQAKNRNEENCYLQDGKNKFSFSTQYIQSNFSNFRSGIGISIPRFYHLGIIPSSFLPFLIRDQQFINYKVLCNNIKEEEIPILRNIENKSSNSQLSGPGTPDYFKEVHIKNECNNKRNCNVFQL